MQECDISAAVLEIHSGVAKCGAQELTSTTDPIRVFGDSSTAGVTIVDSAISLEFSSLVIDAPIALSATHSDVTILLSGPSSLRSTSPGRGGADCNSLSNLTFLALPGGSLNSTGAVGIGVPQGGECGRILVHNGTYNAAGTSGAAIGTGAPDPSVALGELIIRDGEFRATNGPSCAPIGTASVGANQKAFLDRLIIENGTFPWLPGGSAAGIGTGSAIGTGANNTVGTIIIEDGNFLWVTGGPGAAIGTGRAQGGGYASVGRIRIGGGRFQGTSYCAGAVKSDHPRLRNHRHRSSGNHAIGSAPGRRARTLRRVIHPPDEFLPFGRTATAVLAIPATDSHSAE
jgi:hypothetical protein